MQVCRLVVHIKLLVKVQGMKAISCLATVDRVWESSIP